MIDTSALSAVMPLLGCPCGHIHDLSLIPDDGWITLRDQDYEELGEQALNATERQGLLYECPNCGRLLWLAPGSKFFRTFIPEQPDPEPALDSRSILRLGE